MEFQKEKFKSIFDRFIRYEQYDNAVYEGSGLGLSISMAYGEMLGGKIWVESEVSVGSQIYFQFLIKQFKVISLKLKKLIQNQQWIKQTHKKNRQELPEHST